MKLNYIIKENEKYNNLREILKQEFHISDRLLKKLKNNNQIFINNFPVSISSSFKTGDIVSILLDFNETSDNIIPTKMDLSILFEDDAMLIVNKSPYLPVHPSMNHFNDSLSNGIKYYYNSINLNRKIRPVNRLDKNTSGIVIFAKNEYVQESLISQMKSNKFKKNYIALVDGIVEKDKGIINAPISRKENSIIERKVSINGQIAITHFNVLKRYDDYSLVEFLLETGRTHQIRVHSSYLGYPILGDTLYGSSSPYISRQALHAYKIRFIHPITHENLEIIADIPDDIKRLIKQI